MKKAQSSIEFVILVCFLMLSFVLFFINIKDDLEDDLRDRDFKRLQEIGLIVQQEIDLAHESMEGYKREFTLPREVYGKEYTISINESLVFVRIENNQYSTPVQEVMGNILKFDNVIKKENGIVTLNS